VTTLSAEAGRPVTVTEVRAVIERHLAPVLGYRRWRHACPPSDLAAAAEALLASGSPALAS
jgi:predicted component of type VI protein secretion system